MGRKHTLETRLKIGAIHRGKTISDEHKRRLVEAHTGRIIKPEHVEKARVKRIQRAVEHGTKNMKLIKENVLNIVAKANAGQSYTSIAEEYHVAISVISRILSGDRWNHVTGITPSEPKKRTHAPLGMDTAIRIREQYAKEGLSYAELASAYDVNKSTIASIIRGRLYPTPV